MTCSLRCLLAMAIVALFFVVTFTSQTYASDPVEWRAVTVCRGGRCVQILVAQNGQFEHGTQYVQAAAPKPTAKQMPKGPHAPQTAEPPLVRPRFPVAHALICGVMHHVKVMACHVQIVAAKVRDANHKTREIAHRIGERLRHPFHGRFAARRCRR